jgi:hypothetical protein
MTHTNTLPQSRARRIQLAARADRREHIFDIRETEREQTRRELAEERRADRFERARRDLVDFLLETPSERWLRRMR